MDKFKTTELVLIFFVLIATYAFFHVLLSAMFVMFGGLN